MAFIVSDWKVTYNLGGAGAFQLCDFDDEIDEELSLPWSQAVDTSKPTRATTAKKYGRGAMETSFTLGVWKTHASQQAARNYLLEHAASVTKGVSKSLRIQVQSGNSYNLSDAVIVSGDGRMVVGGALIRTWVQYKIEGGSFTVV